MRCSEYCLMYVNKWRAHGVNLIKSPFNIFCCFLPSFTLLSCHMSAVWSSDKCQSVIICCEAIQGIKTGGMCFTWQLEQELLWLPRYSQRNCEVIINLPSLLVHKLNMHIHKYHSWFIQLLILFISWNSALSSYFLSLTVKTTFLWNMTHSSSKCSSSGLAKKKKKKEDLCVNAEVFHFFAALNN